MTNTKEYYYHMINYIYREAGCPVKTNHFGAKVMRRKRVTITLICTLLANIVLGISCISPAQEQIMKGDNFLKQGQWDETIAAYNKAMELDSKLNKAELKPKLTIAYAKRGHIFNIQGEYDKVISDYTKAIDLDPKYAWAYYNRGNAYTLKGDYEKAIDDYDKALELNTKDAWAYNNRGIAYKLEGKYDRAIADYDKAVELDSEDAWVYYNRGNAYKLKGDYEKAITDYNKAIEMDPNDEWAYEKQAYLNKWLELDPKVAWAYNNRGNTYIEMVGEYDRAIADYTRAIQMEPTDIELYYNRHKAYRHKNDDSKAFDDTIKAKELGMKYTDGWYSFDDIYIDKGDHAKPEADWRQAK